MTVPSSTEARARDLFLWAVGTAVGGIVLAVLVRLVPSPAIHAAGVMFLPFLVPIVAILAVIAAILAALVLVRTRRDREMKRLGLTVTLVGSVLLVILLPVLVLVAQVLVTFVGGFVR